MNRTTRTNSADLNEYRLFSGSFTNEYSVKFDVTDGMI